MAATKKAAVIGWPVQHSLSPLLHQFWLKQYRIDGTYEKIAVEEKDLARFINSLRGGEYKGVNVTVPYKERVMPLLDEIDESAKTTGAVNVISVTDGKLIGSNTDIFGFRTNLEGSGLPLRKKHAVILGAGGAARAVLKSLSDMGFAGVSIVARDSKKAQELRNLSSTSVDIISWDDRNEILSSCDLLVNATTLGMKGKEILQIDLSLLPSHAVVYDIVYNPLITGLLQQARTRKLGIVDGLGMLIYQAVPCFEAWFGMRPQVTEELRDYLIGKIS